MSQFDRAVMAFRIEKVLPSHCAKYVTPAFNGDVQAAFSLSCFLDNADRGAMALAMWQAKIPREAFRAYFAPVWMHDHRRVIEAAQTRRRLADMFRYAAFALPAELPDVVRVWRGSSKLSLEDASKGYSWTTDKDVACWFAMRFAADNGAPLVLAADVPKTEIALFTDERSEQEALLLKPPAGLFIDGTEADWALGHKRKEAAYQASRTAMLNAKGGRA